MSASTLQTEPLESKDLLNKGGEVGTNCVTSRTRVRTQKHLCIHIGTNCFTSGARVWLQGSGHNMDFSPVLVPGPLDLSTTDLLKETHRIVLRCAECCFLLSASCLLFFCLSFQPSRRHCNQIGNHFGVRATDESCKEIKIQAYTSN